MQQPLMEAIDALVAKGGRFMPHWGWHDDHREADGSVDYKPALQQVRSETSELLGILLPALNKGKPTQIPGSCLQLGLGATAAAHEALRLVFEDVVTLDWSACWHNEEEYPGADIALEATVDWVAEAGPYDFLIIDAGHTFEDAKRDHENYGQLVRPGGIIAFHDALLRPGFEEAVQVWRYLETLTCPVHMIGSEVGVAWLRKE